MGPLSQRNVFLLMGLLLALSSGVGAQNRSIVQVSSGNSTGSGFVWKQPTWVVTAAHVVLNSSNVTVRVLDGSGSFTSHSARVIKVLRRADLALIETDRSMSVSPLEISPQTVVRNRKYEIIGFPLAATQTSKEMTVPRIGADTLSGVIGGRKARVMADLGLLDENVSIIHLQGGVSPGYSGAPLVDSEERVIGIISGGVEEGVSTLGWAMPSSYLKALEISDETRIQISDADLARAEAVWSADLKGTFSGNTQPPSRNFNLNGKTFYLSRSRMFSKIVSNSLNPQIVTYFQNLVPQHLKPDLSELSFDIYESPDSEVIFVVPSGMDLRTLPFPDPQVSVECVEGNLNGEFFYRAFLDTALNAFQADQITAWNLQNTLTPKTAPVAPLWTVDVAHTAMVPFVNQKGISKPFAWFRYQMTDQFGVPMRFANGAPAVDRYAAGVHFHIGQDAGSVFVLNSNYGMQTTDDALMRWINFHMAAMLTGSK